MPNSRNVPDLPLDVLRAISFAARRHRTQMRKDGETPYVSHPFRVLFLVRHVFGVEDVPTLTAAVLHDTLEDTTTDRDDIAEEFGETVASYVAALSKDKRMPEREREDRYFEGLAGAPLAVKLCKLGDTLDNLIDVQGLDEKARRKAVAKAERLLGILGDGLPPEARRAAQIVRAQAGL